MRRRVLREVENGVEEKKKREEVFRGYMDKKQGKDLVVRSKAAGPAN